MGTPANDIAGQDDSLMVCVLASGSKGNAIFLSDRHTSVLVDAGLSGIEIERRLAQRGINPDLLDAILVSHEHVDHIQGVGVLSRRFNVPVYISRKTAQRARSILGCIEDVRHFKCGNTFDVKTLIIHPFTISHDAHDPAGFTVTRNGMKIGIATDLGVATAMVKEHLKGCQLLILEANHDPEMLINGPYPWPLKQRIQSRTGHLSNQASGKLVKALNHDDLQYIILAHLSETNNTPQKAIQAVGSVLIDGKPQLYVATQDECSELFYLHNTQAG